MAEAPKRKILHAATKPKVDPLVAATVPAAVAEETEAEQARRTGKRIEAEAAVAAEQPLPDAIVAPTPDPAPGHVDLIGENLEAAVLAATGSAVAEQAAAADDAEVDAVFDGAVAVDAADDPAPVAHHMTLHAAIDIACAALGRAFALKPGDDDRERMAEDCPEAVAHNRLLDHRNAHDHEIG